MRTIRLILKEIAHRWPGFLLGALGVALAVAACQCISALHGAAQRETRRVQRDIGFNMRIIPREADPERFLIQGYSTETMPEEIIQRLAQHKTVAYNHLVATLQGEINLDGKPALLTGLSPTMFPSGKKKPPMSPTIKEGTAHLGHRLAERLGLKKGETLLLAELPFEVVRVAPQTGSLEDLRVWVQLGDAQKILGKAGQINEIQAIDCLCLAPDENPGELLRAEVSKVAPEAQVALLSKIATARARQRRMMDSLAQTAVPAIIVAAAVWVAVFAWINVRQRKFEIGVLRALGHPASTIASLILGKAFLLGLAGGAIGCLLGSWYVTSRVAEIFPVTGGKFQFETNAMLFTLVAAPVIACVASCLAASLALVQDPAVVLREE